MMNESEEFNNLVDDMLLDHKYEFANDFLESMQKTFKKYKRFTENQQIAIQNIYDSKNQD